MVRLGLIQTVPYGTNRDGVVRVSQGLKRLGRKEADVVCLPEQWLKRNQISDFDSEFLEFKRIAREYSMTVIAGAFYEVSKGRTSIVAPVIGPKGEIIGRQEKIHPFGYERDTVRPGREARVFKTACKFGVVVCYDMVFPGVASALVRKGAQVLLSPSRIVRRGVRPWEMYVQVRSLENRVPILAANVEDRRFGGNSMIVDLAEDGGVVKTRVSRIGGEGGASREFDLSKYVKSRRARFRDSNKFH